MILPRRLAAGSTQMKGSEYAVAPEQGKKTDVDHKGIMVIKLSVSEYWIQVEQNSCNQCVLTYIQSYMNPPSVTHNFLVLMGSSKTSTASM